MSPEKIGLWSHQQAALAYLQGRQCSLLDLAMGSGKSRVIVQYVCTTPAIQRVLILCPRSFVQGWGAQFEQHGVQRHCLSALLDHTAGTVPQRVRTGQGVLAEAVRQLAGYVCVMNYDVCWRAGMAEFLRKAHFDLIVCDEIQRVRAGQTAVSRFVYKLSATIPIKIGLSGTPFPETPLDSYGVCRALDPTLLGTSWLRFRNRYAEMGGFMNYTVKRYINQEELQTKINTLRFTMKPSGYELPAEQDIVIPLTLPPKVQKLYRTLATDLYSQVGYGSVTLANAAVAFTALQRLCSGVVVAEDASGVKESLSVHTLKEEALRDILQSVPRQQSVVVLCRFHCDLAAVHTVAASVGRISTEVSGRPGHTPAHVRGGVWVGPETVLAVQGSAGVEGIDLTRAHVMIFYSYVLELGKFQQARARICRAGQAQPCTYYHLVVRDGIDQRIRVLLENKQQVLQGLFASMKKGDKII